MKRLAKAALRSLGFEIHRIPRASMRDVPGSSERPTGDIHRFLEDIRARGFQPRGIIDVGANRGDWTVMALSVFPDARALLIEPQQEMLAPLQLLAQRTGIEWVAAGAGAEAGELVQTIWDDLYGSSFLPPTDPALLQSGKQRVTSIVTIDSLLRERPAFHPDLVKLDVQGFELEVLKGASSLMGRTEVFILETLLYQFLPACPLTIDCINFMAERGYALYDITEFLRRPFDGALGCIDIAFARCDGMLRASQQWS